MAAPRVRFSRSITVDNISTDAFLADPSLLRFDGVQKRSSPWDALLRDHELWFDHANCMVHYHSRGSHHDANLRIPISAVRRTKSAYLLDKCLHRLETPASSDDEDSGYGGSSSGDGADRQFHLYVPAPSGLTTEEVLQYHLTTRNYIAFVVSKPAVGVSLGTALIDLWTRIQSWHPRSTSRDDFHRYCQEQGYHDIANNPNAALALLAVAERAQLRATWLEAFVHCVGMSHVLPASPEYQLLSARTKSLVTGAAYEMGHRVRAMTGSLCNFLEIELGPETLGLSKDARQHLDRFRSSLLRHYIGTMRCFPPGSDNGWERPLWATLREDFQAVYSYLADTESSSDWSSNRGFTGGICVSQNVLAFDERYGFDPLPHPLPLLPVVMPIRKRTMDNPTKALRSLRMRSSETQLDLKAVASDALVLASNLDDSTLLENPLVRIYMHFEQERLEERISSGEARKVRWLLVYGVLQMLNGMLAAPGWLNDQNVTTYPLCVTTPVHPPWGDHSDMFDPADSKPESTDGGDVERHISNTDRIEIRPDCEAENAEDYFTKTNISRTASTVSMTGDPPPLSRVGSQLSRTASLRSGMNSIQRSVRGSISRHGGGLRRASLLLQPSKKPSWADFALADSGSESTVGLSSRAVSQDDLATLLGTRGMVISTYAQDVFAASHAELTEEPGVYYDLALDEKGVQHHYPRHPSRGESVDLSLPSPIESHLSEPSACHTNPSSRRSSYQDDCSSSVATEEICCWTTPTATFATPAPSATSDPSLSAFQFDLTPLADDEIAHGSVTPTLAARPYQSAAAPRRAVVSVNAGCYVPTTGRSPRRTTVNGIGAR